MVIHSRVEAPDWSAQEDEEAQARCRAFPLPSRKYGREEDAWFSTAIDALPICNGEFEDTHCPFRARCLNMSLINNDTHGVWGGMTVPQRKWIRTNVDRKHWGDDAYLRKATPGPDEFDDYGDEERDASDDET